MRSVASSSAATSPSSASAFSTAPPSPQSSSPLFRLPGELRERIYAFALHHRSYIIWPAEHFRTDIALPLILTSRAVYHEATPVLYAQNHFTFKHPSDLNMFIAVADARYARKITNMYLRIRDTHLQTLWTGYLSSSSLYRSLAHDLPCLRYLHVWFQSNFWANDNMEAFSRWTDDKALESLCLTLKGHVPPGADVKIVCMHKVARRDVDVLLRGYPGQLERIYNGDVRTGWKLMHNALVCLEMSPVDPSQMVGAVQAA